MEERYLNSPRRAQGGRRVAPSKTRRAAPAKKHSPGKRLLGGFYKFLVVISALVVAVYLGVHFLLKPPEQSNLPPPDQNHLAEPGGTAETPGDRTPGGSAQRTRRPGVYNIFLAATDLEGFRPDVMMVLCYDTVEQTVGVASVPRDTLVARKSGSPHLAYGKGGLEERVREVSNMLGVPIDYYIKVNIKGFITLVDYLNGIDFYVPCNMNYDDPEQNLHIHYKEGQTHLNGQQAMEVARFRKNNKDKDGKVTGYSDTGRTETQQKLLIALAKKVLSWNSLTKINGFVEIFNDNVSTDLSVSDMLYFASQAVNLDLNEDIQTATLEGRGDGVYRGYRYCYELAPEAVLEQVNTLINPYEQELTLDDMNLAKAEY